MAINTSVRSLCFTKRAGLVANKVSQEANPLWKCPRIKGAADELKRALDLKAGAVKRLIMKMMDEKRGKEIQVNVRSPRGFQLPGIQRSCSKSLLLPSTLLRAPESRRAPKGALKSSRQI